MKKYFLSFILMSPVLIYAQSIQEIRSHYKAIADLIADCESECSLYKNELIVNSNNGSWRAVGTYSKSVEFWYTDDPTKCDECVLGGLSVLEKVVVREAGSTYKSLTELLFKNGVLIFCYRKNEDEEGLNEQRFYFEKGTLIRYQLNGDVLTPSASDEGMNRYIARQSDGYQKVFLNSF